MRNLIGFRCVSLPGREDVDGEIWISKRDAHLTIKISWKLINVFKFTGEMQNNRRCTLGPSGMEIELNRMQINTQYGST